MFVREQENKSCQCVRLRASAETPNGGRDLAKRTKEACLYFVLIFRSSDNRFVQRREGRLPHRFTFIRFQKEGAVRFAKMGRTQYEPVSSSEEEPSHSYRSESKLEQEILAERKRAKEREKIRNKVEGLLWLVVSGCIVWYGNGKKNFVSVVATDERIAR